jgi:hypothetical protein
MCHQRAQQVASQLHLITISKFKEIILRLMSEVWGLAS